MVSERQTVDEIIKDERLYRVVDARKNVLVSKLDMRLVTIFCDGYMSVYPSFCRDGMRYYVGSIPSPEFLRLSIEVCCD